MVGSQKGRLRLSTRDWLMHADRDVRRPVDGFYLRRVTNPKGNSKRVLP